MKSSSTRVISSNSKIGFDLGNTIFHKIEGVTVAFPDALEVIQRLVKGRAGYIISKVTPEQELHARSWLDRNDFGKLVCNENTYFCARRADKAPIAQRLGLTHFIDDRPEVLAHMEDIVPFRILFQGEEKDFILHREQLRGIHRVNSWREVERLLL